MTTKLVLIDGVKWHDQYPQTVPNLRSEGLEPICHQHNLRLTPQGAGTKNLYCMEGDGHVIVLPRSYILEKKYVVDKLDSRKFSQMSVLNLDDEMIPVATEELKDTDYWIRARVTESKSGARLIIWAGSKKDKNKAQLFVEPELKRMSFDQNDDHPNEVFAKVEATFKDGIRANIEKDK